MSDLFLFSLSIGLLGAGDVTVSSAVGVSIDFTGAPARDLDMIRDAGLGWVRRDLDWESVETAKGEYRFAPYDELLDGLEARGIRALFVLDHGDRLPEERRSVRTDAGRAAFARFAAAAAARYRGRGVWWEIWNEPDRARSWEPVPSADEYCQLAVAAARAIRAADPAAVILAPAVSGFSWEFLDRAFALGLLDQIDHVSVHPHRSTPPETAREDFLQLTELIQKRAPPGKALPGIVSGEWGYPQRHGGRRIPADVQAAYLVRQFLTNVAAGIPLSIWHEWANEGSDPGNAEPDFGMVTGKREPKDAYLAARTLGAMAGRLRFSRRLHAAAGDHLLVFTGGKLPVLAAWTEGAPRSAVLAGDWEGPVRLVSLTGEERTLTPSDGLVEAPLTGSPCYLELTADPARFAVHGLDVHPSQKSLQVAVIRTGPGKEEGFIETRVGGRAMRHPVVLEEASIARIDVEIEWPADPPLPVSVTLWDATGRRKLAAAPAACYSAMTAYMEEWVQASGSLRNFQVSVDGDAKARGFARVTERDFAPHGPPQPKALVCSYQLGEGRSVRIAPVERPEIPGSPRALLLLVNGDGSGVWLRSRFKDAAGEIFQPAGVEVTWKGWKWVRLPLDGSEASHWGAKSDGKVDYPLRWDSLFLVDPGAETSSGSLDFQYPLLVYDAE